MDSNRDQIDNNMDKGDLRNNNLLPANKEVLKDLLSKTSTSSTSSTKKRTKTVVSPKERPKRKRQMKTVFRDELCFVPKTAWEKRIFGTNSKSIEVASCSTAPSESKKNRATTRPKPFPLNTSECSPQKICSTKVTGNAETTKGKTTPFKQANTVPTTKTERNTLQEQNNTDRSFEKKAPQLKQSENLVEPDFLKETKHTPVSTKRITGRPANKRTVNDQKGPGRSKRKIELVQAGSAQQETTDCKFKDPQIPEPPAKRTRSHTVTKSH